MRAPHLRVVDSDSVCVSREQVLEWVPVGDVGVVEDDRYAAWAKREKVENEQQITRGGQ